MPADYSRFNALRITVAGPVLTIAISNPPHNAITRDAHRELSEVFYEVQKDETVRAVVFTGEGEVFSAGGDIEAMVTAAKAKDYAHWSLSMTEARRILISMLDLDKPIIARVNGHAMGLGASLVLFSDIAVMSSKAKLADPHVQVGLTAGDGGALIWPQLMGYARAKRYLLTGDRLSAAQCLEFGLVAEVVEPEDLDRTVADLAARLCQLSPRAVATTKRAINIPLLREAVSSADAHLGLETFAKLTDDHLEAATAIRDKRPPAFTGR